MMSSLKNYKLLYIMKHNKPLYIILAIVVLFLIMYNFKLLEGYTYIPDMDLKNKKNVGFTNLTLTQCNAKCNNKNTCVAFTSTIDVNSDSTFKGDCTIYKPDEGTYKTDLNLSRLQNLKYTLGTNLYIN
jgi:hypothetical protein